MRIDKYEFRTRRAKGKNPGGDAASSAEKKTISRPSETAQGIPSQPGTAAGNKTNGVNPRRNA